MDGKALRICLGLVYSGQEHLGRVDESCGTSALDSDIRVRAFTWLGESDVCELWIWSCSRPKEYSK